VPQTLSVYYDRPVQVHTIRFIGGRTFAGDPAQGGWFEKITPQVLVGGQWKTPVLSAAPVPAQSKPFAMLDFVLAAPMQATGIRISGTPGGAAAFVTCMELDALSSPPLTLTTSVVLNFGGTRSIDDLYAWFAAPADLNADGAADDADLRYLESAIRAGEIRRMAVHP
jgi:hypothetical protein